MAKITLCMIVKDEEDFIENAITSVQSIVDEIVVVDTGSKDSTKQLAEDLGAKVIDFKWQDDFSKARNESLKHATGDWILVLDADEAIAEDDLKKLKKLTDSKEATAYLFTQKTYTNDSKLKDWNSIQKSSKETKGFSGWVPSQIVRLFKNNKGIKFDGVVHESVMASIHRINGKVVETDIPIHHYGMLKPSEKKKEKDKLYLKLGKKKAQSGDAKSFYELGKQFIEIKNYPEAIKSFIEAVKVKADYIEAFADLGMAYMEIGRLEDAKLSLSKAVSLGSKSHDAFNNLGVVYAKMGRHNDAILCFMKAIDLSHNFAAAYMNLGMALDALGRKDEAVLCFAAAVKLDPKYKEQVQFQ